MSLFSKLFQRTPTPVASTEKPVQSTARPAVRPSRLQTRPQLTWTGARYEFRCSAGQGYAATEAGFHHDLSNNCYWSGVVECARQLAIYADDRARARFNAIDH